MKNILSKLKRLLVPNSPNDSRLLNQNGDLETEWYDFFQIIGLSLNQSSTIQEIKTNLYVCRVGAIAFVCGKGNFSDIDIGVKPLFTLVKDNSIVSTEGMFSHTGKDEFHISFIGR